MTTFRTEGSSAQFAVGRITKAVWPGKCSFKAKRGAVFGHVVGFAKDEWFPLWEGEKLVPEGGKR